MKAAVALAVSISLLGCFPNNARHRTYAKIGEGTALVAGIAISAFANTGADCDEENNNVDNCRSTAKWLSTVGVILILGGLLGFVATISTAQDDSQSTARVISREKTEGSGSGSGSAAPTEGSGSAAPGATDGSAATPPATDPATTPPAGGTVPEGTGVPAPNQFQWN